MIEIDGSYGEGGGAILRQALGLAAYAGAPVRVTSIRAGRRKPGLRPQHLAAAEAVSAICGAQVEGAELGSTELRFEPGEVRSGSFDFDIGTAGSTTLLLQTVLVPCLFHDGEFTFELVGGTDVPWSPPADYLSQVMFPAAKALGTARLQVRRRGYYPKGGGWLDVRLTGGMWSGSPLELLKPGGIAGVHGISHAARALAGRRVAERQAEAANAALTRLQIPVEIEVEYSAARNPGSGISLWTETSDGPALGGSALGAPGKAAQQVGREAARTLLGEIDSGAIVDRHLADQLVPFMAVAGGALSTSEITLHTRSNVYVSERILGTAFDIEDLKVTARP